MSLYMSSKDEETRGLCPYMCPFTCLYTFPCMCSYVCCHMCVLFSLCVEREMSSIRVRVSASVSLPLDAMQVRVCMNVCITPRASMNTYIRIHACIAWIHTIHTYSCLHTYSYIHIRCITAHTHTLHNCLDNASRRFFLLCVLMCPYTPYLPHISTHTRTRARAHTHTHIQSILNFI